MSLSAKPHRSTDRPAAPHARAFRDALGRFATGVAFVTAAPDGEPYGLIVLTV
jgi:flavin reductase (DIM6/NTAB) family NADH-FMN oxidoreductase RutF